MRGENGTGRAPQSYGRQRSARRRWDASNPGNAAARRELADALLSVAHDALAAGMPTLDVGCGSGWWLAELAEHQSSASELHGVDVDPRRVEAAAQRAPAATVAVGDAAALPFPDRRFGLVTLVVVLSSLPSRHAIVGALCEAGRVLAPGGMIAVYEPRIPNPLNRAVRLVRARDFARAGLVPRSARTLTLLPQVGRRLGPLTPTLHPRLSRVSLLRSHRLAVYRVPVSPHPLDAD